MQHLISTGRSRLLVCVAMAAALVWAPSASASSSLDKRAIRLAERLNVSDPAKVWGSFSPAQRKLAMRA